LETLGAVVGSLGFITLLVGVVMFIPVQVFRARRRWALRLTFGGLAAVIFGLVASPPKPIPETAVKATAPSATPAIAASPSSPPKTAGASAVEKAKDASSEQTKREFVELYRQVLKSGGPCDKAIGAMAIAAKTGDQYATYQVAKEGEEACGQASTAIQDLQVPSGLSNEAASAVEKGIKTCSSAYVFRQMGMQKAMQVADGDGKPSVVSDMVDNLKTGQTGVMLCVAELFEASSKVGVDTKLMK
jgi:hypothetical protein